MKGKVSSRHCLKDKNFSAWDEAISDAERLLKEAQERVKQLSDTVRVFRKRRDAGEPFFGQEQKEAKP